MKKIIEQVDSEGLEKLLGENVMVLCMNYFYHGKLTGVNENDILLTDARIVFDSGSWEENGFDESERLPNPLYVRVAAIESYLVLNNETS